MCKPGNNTSNKNRKKCKNTYNNNDISNNSRNSFKNKKQEWIICIILFGLVISLELVNSAIETTVDIAMPEINEKAKNC